MAVPDEPQIPNENKQGDERPREARGIEIIMRIIS
jgi:hypothetical protein